MRFWTAHFFQHLSLVSAAVIKSENQMYDLPAYTIVRVCDPASKSGLKIHSDASDENNVN